MYYKPEFLEQLDKLNLRTQYIKIVLLSFDNERPEKEIQGTITSGNLSVNGSSAVRRTINFSMLASNREDTIPMMNKNSDLENLENDISADKKVRVEVGLKNPHLKSWSEYDKDEIIWFPCGVFIISTANISRGTNGWNISVTAKDKMCLLDGTVGGVLPASVTFHEKQIILDNGDITTEHPTIFQIIFEAVNHWGGEMAENIIISDIEDTVKMLVRYMGDSPIWFSSDYSAFDFVSHEGWHKFEYGDDVGYKETEFTYPGELVLKPGDTVVTLLDKIKTTLGNFEYYYDIDGRFIFQQVKNYLNTPSNLYKLDPENYVKSYNNKKAVYSLTGLESVTQIAQSPNFSNLKNDFYAWGKRKSASGAEIPIRYHLAIDTKPKIHLAGQYMWLVYSKEENDNLYIRYDFNDMEEYDVPGYETRLIGPPCNEWREELYRRALVAQTANSQDDGWYTKEEQVYDNPVATNYYDAELISEWRKLYDPLKWPGGWNPQVRDNPETLDFWLDFIDGSSAAIGKYRIKQIGRRTKVVNNDSMKSVYNKEVPDVVFFEGYNQDKIAKYKDIGQMYFILQPEYYDLFSISTTGASCFDTIREMLYQNLNYNTAVSITCLPRYYMEPNTIIYIEDADSNIQGNYQVTQFSLPLAYNGTMTIQATEVLTRV